MADKKLGLNRRKENRPPVRRVTNIKVGDHWMFVEEHEGAYSQTVDGIVHDVREIRGIRGVEITLGAGDKLFTFEYDPTEMDAYMIKANKEAPEPSDGSLYEVTDASGNTTTFYVRHGYHVDVATGDGFPWGERWFNDYEILREGY